MGMQYDGTPPTGWIGAKVYAEYAIMLINKSMERDLSEDIPMPVAMSVQSNFKRAVNSLPPEMKRAPEEVTRYKEGCGSWDQNLEALEKIMKEVFVPDPADPCRYTGVVPAKSILAVLYSLQDIFASAYAACFFHARAEWFRYCGDDEPDEEEFNADVWREVYETGLSHWHTNETAVFANLYRDGWNAGHVSRLISEEDNLINTPTRIRKPKPASPETPSSKP